MTRTEIQTALTEVGQAIAVPPIDRVDFQAACAPSADVVRRPVPSLPRASPPPWSPPRAWR